ncbi:protoglobin domain-containing protein [Bacillus sp. FJAT-45350]|uniref:protoglobin domain-containing protein n=1 Tax=Bacillus sp. FJAT-45350 TaxID=2011014 RepID=UPI000BB84B9C|nr:protoglobin domain-containing protein [Bacillus sp. FJAT-45350]
MKCSVIDVTNEGVLEQLRFLDLTSEDLLVVKRMQPFITKHIDLLVDSFYQVIIQVEELKEIIGTHSSMERLETTLKVHLIELFNGKIDEQFINKRLKVAEIHFSIGLKPRWYMGAFHNLQNKLFRLIEEQITDPKENTLYINVATKILNLEQQLVLEAYEKESKDYHTRQNELLIKAEKLSVVGQLAAGFAHEIRNPLTTLKGFTQYFKAEAKEKHLPIYDLLLSELDRLESITNEFMIVAKPQKNNYKDADVKQILVQVLSLLNPQALMNNIQFIIQTEKEIPIISCNENQLKQVFINLLKNAMEAMPDGGDILLQMETCEKKVILIKVIDSGIGISKECISKIGEPFYSLKEKGTGLGLMVTYKIIEAHNGKVEFFSQPNKGTTVTITLPFL